LLCGTDCAEIYGNEAEIGEAFKAAFDEGLVKRCVRSTSRHGGTRTRELMGAWCVACNREELFITSKVFNNHHQPERVVKAIHNTLKNLQIPYLVRPLLSLAASRWHT
jgi:alcohol dehydrogenase (NADP+)